MRLQGCETTLFLIKLALMATTKQLFFLNKLIWRLTHSVKRVRTWSNSAPHFPAFGLNTDRYGVPHLFIYLPSFVDFPNKMSYKAENWHAQSHEQYLSKHQFLNICS